VSLWVPVPIGVAFTATEAHDASVSLAEFGPLSPNFQCIHHSKGAIQS
jgi:hypothetical protein